ncbi:hypothetical protein LZ32DRAFT_598126 [Colletotrichum eremochloae]|nr:hypothetical protein LZ32DRAFT_598126 [Colletotrichum eremochloae]
MNGPRLGRLGNSVRAIVAKMTREASQGRVGAWGLRVCLLSWPLTRLQWLTQAQGEGRSAVRET